MLMAIAYIAPFLLALAGVVVVRWFAGAEHASRWGGLAAAVGFFIGWQILVDPAWSPKTAHDRIGHIVLGATLVGLAADVWPARRWLRTTLMLGLVLGSAWISVSGGITLKTLPELGAAIAGVTLAIAWLGTAARYSMLREQGATFSVIVVSGLLGVAVVAGVSGDAVVTKATFAAASAWLGHAIGCRLVGVPPSWTALSLATAATFAAAWALAVGKPAAIPGLALLLFVLFADRTARRVPMPGGRISDFLYIAVLAGAASIPVILAAVVTAARINQ